MHANSAFYILKDLTLLLQTLQNLLITGFLQNLNKLLKLQQNILKNMNIIMQNLLQKSSSGKYSAKITLRLLKIGCIILTKEAKKEKNQRSILFIMLC